ncbi:gluconokinase [Bacillus luteus]|uniref:Gluconokinase n=1 Tax=Alkalicoccus luteus TaxID=1237094 RepID=A0A969PKV8_9BACI|nr:gluconokinase [Alkalicoccus luteus]
MVTQFTAGLDLGTTSAKAVLFTKAGEVAGEAECSYPVQHPQPGWAEQDPFAIEAAAVKALKEAVADAGPGELLSVGLSSAMHSLICADADAMPLSPAITWADCRSSSQADALKESSAGTEIYLRTGTPIHPMSPLVKLSWMRDTGYAPYKQAARFLSVKEWITARWFGVYHVDYSVASASGLFNIHERTWEPLALEAAGITEAQLSEPVPPHFVFRGLDPEKAEAIGIKADTPFAAGGSDGPLANLGIGAINAGEAAITIGTSGAIRQMASAPRTDSRQEVFCYAFTDDLWILGGPTNNGGNVLEWIKQHIHTAEAGTKDPYEALFTDIEHVAPGADNLLFLPCLNGERAPYWDAAAKGAYVGLTVSHTDAHMTRAGLEGVLFSIQSISKSLERLTGEAGIIYASGGFARSDVWVQMLANMFGEDIHLPLSHQSSAWGAAWISLYAIGEVDDLASIKAHIPMRDSVAPRADVHAVYSRLYPVFSGLYEALRPTFHELHALSTDTTMASASKR